VTPRAAIPIRLASGLGSQAEAEAFVGAARNGADVISCSWGPPDGAWWDPNDPAHRQVGLLPDSTRLALPFASTQGRSGKGCVVLFVTGNGNESVDNARVIAVAACNDLLKRSAYSEFGKAVWSSVPSSDGRPSLTPGIWTTSRSGGLDHNQGSPPQGRPCRSPHQFQRRHLHPRSGGAAAAARRPGRPEGQGPQRHLDPGGA
jgi:subtilisin family serine protease